MNTNLEGVFTSLRARIASLIILTNGIQTEEIQLPRNGR